MARARLVKPGLFANEELAALSVRSRLLFVGLWTLADKRGRLEDRPMRIKGALFPYENVPLERHLAELASAGFITRYVAEGEKYIQIWRFEAHQKPHVNEPESKIPAPPGYVSPASTNGASPSTIGTSARAEAETETETEALTRSFDPEAEAEAEAESAVRDILLLLQQGGISERGLELKVRQAIPEHGFECISHALEEAVEYNKPSWAYMRAVMDRHRRDGCPPAEHQGTRKRDRMVAGLPT